MAQTEDDSDSRGDRAVAVAAFGVAILPPPDVGRELIGLRRLHPLLSHHSPPHITIKAPFVPRHTPALLLERLAEAIGPIEPFDLRLDGLGAFNQAVLYVQVRRSAALSALHRAVVEAPDGMVETFEPRYDGANFTPHLTLAGKLTPAEFETARRALGAYRPRATFTVERVHLLKAVRGTWRDRMAAERWEPGRSVDLGTAAPLPAIERPPPHHRPSEGD